MKKHSLFFSAFTTIRSVKPAWLAEPIFLTPILIMEDHAGDAGRAG